MFNWLQHLFTARALQRELADAQSQIAVLNQKNTALQSELEQLKKKNEPIQHSGRLEELKEKTLIIISQRDGITASAVASTLGINEQFAKFHLQELANAGLAGATLNMAGGPGKWGLMHGGRRYLAEHGLLAQPTVQADSRRSAPPAA